MEAPSDGFGVHPNWARLDLKEVDKPKSKPKPKMSSPESWPTSRWREIKPRKHVMLRREKKSTLN